MLFSVIIPTCNRNNLLTDCLNCLVPGTQSAATDSYEVIITDDSNDDIAKALILEKFPDMKWIPGPKKGPASNRNNGARHAQGKWLIFLDDDCLPHNDLIENYALLIQKNPGVNVFEGWIEREGKMTSPILRAPGNSNTNGGYLLSCNFLILKDVFDELNGFDENFKYPHMEDYDFNERVLAKKETVVFAVEAKVMHPWRMIKSGWKLGRFEEMTVYYHAKNKNPLKLHTLLKYIAGSHWRIIKWFVKRLIFSADVFTAIKIMLEHMIVVVFNFNKWKAKYYK